MERTIEEYKKQDDYTAVQKFSRSIVHHAYIRKMFDLVEIEHLRNHWRTVFLGTLEYPVLYPGDDKYEWHEINVFAEDGDNGTRTVNILGRDVTEIHEIQEKSDRELKAAVEKNQILSEITKMLYSYNMTVNVDTGKYTLITGTGLDDTVARMEATDQFDDIYQNFLNAVDPEYLEKGKELLSLDNYRGKQDKTGHLGTGDFLIRYSEKPEWHEINVFAGYDENGEAIINILGRDVTEAHDKADTKAQLEIANASNAAKSAFLFNMSHDIRTPMNAIIGFTELLDKHLDDKELARDYIKKIQTSNDFLLSLINNVLEMAIVKNLVDLMQGTIKVESKIGKGTKFTITLPHRLAEKGEISKRIEKANNFETGLFRGKRILLAEDNDLNAEIAATILEETGFMVERAVDGKREQAIEVAVNMARSVNHAKETRI